MAVERARYRDAHPEEEAPPPPAPSTMSVREMLEEVRALADAVLGDPEEAEYAHDRLKALADALLERVPT